MQAEEDLYLSGSQNTIRRVTADTNYSCLMLKSQRFSSLFRHYAKYHGLRKDDLEYYFVNPLENEDTPETVHLQRGDTIIVRKRKRPDPPESAADDEEFLLDMQELLDDEEHMDCVFLVHPHGEGGGGMGGLPLAAGAGAGAGAGAAAAAAGGKRSRPTQPAADAIPRHTVSPGGGRLGSVLGGEGGKGPPMTPGREELSGPGLVQMDGDGGGGGGEGGRRQGQGQGEAKAVEDDDDAAGASGGSRSDAEYLVEIRAHKCILTARGEYFKALFRKGSSSSSAPAKGGGSASSSSSSLVVAFRESTENTIKVDEEFGPRIVRLMLEFVYTNKIRGIRRAHLEDLLGLLHLSDRWLLRDLKRLVEHEIINHHIDINSVPRIYCATEDYHARRLSKACIDYIMENIREVAGNASFQDHLSSYPELCIPILRAAAEMMPEPTPKRSRTAADHHPSTPGTVRDEEG